MISEDTSSQFFESLARVLQSGFAQRVEDDITSHVQLFDQEPECASRRDLVHNFRMRQLHVLGHDAQIGEAIGGSIVAPAPKLP